jgi:diguanylate cyclase (GGDEF)-like protein
MVARYGGDEIAVLLPETDKSKATEIAEKLRCVIERTSFEWEGEALNVTSTIGIASSLDDHVAAGGDMLDKADKALYKGKGIGKNAVVALKSTIKETPLRSSRLEGGPNWPRVS